MGLAYVRGVLCVGTVLLFGTVLLNLTNFLLSSLVWNGLLLARHGERWWILDTLLVGLGLLLFVLFALFVPLSVIGDDFAIFCG